MVFGRETWSVVGKLCGSGREIRYMAGRSYLVKKYGLWQKYTVRGRKIDWVVYLELRIYKWKEVGYMESGRYL